MAQAFGRWAKIVDQGAGQLFTFAVGLLRLIQPPQRLGHIAQFVHGDRQIAQAFGRFTQAFDLCADLGNGFLGNLPCQFDVAKFQCGLKRLCCAPS